MQDASEDTIDKLWRLARGAWNWYWHRGGREWVHEHLGHAQAIDRMQDFGKEPVAGDQFFHAEDTPQTKWSILKFDSADQAKHNAELLQSKGIECEAVGSDIVLRESDAKRIAEEHLLEDTYTPDKETITTHEVQENLKNYEEACELDEALKDPEFARQFDEYAAEMAYEEEHPEIAEYGQYLEDLQNIEEYEASLDATELKHLAEHKAKIDAQLNADVAPDLTEYMTEKHEIAETINSQGARTQEHTLETIHNEISR